MLFVAYLSVLFVGIRAVVCSILDESSEAAKTYSGREHFLERCKKIIVLAETANLNRSVDVDPLEFFTRQIENCREVLKSSPHDMAHLTPEQKVKLFEVLYPLLKSKLITTLNYCRLKNGELSYIGGGTKGRMTLEIKHTYKSIHGFLTNLFIAGLRDYAEHILLFKALCKAQGCTREGALCRLGGEFEFIDEDLTLFRNITKLEDKSMASLTFCLFAQILAIFLVFGKWIETAVLDDALKVQLVGAIFVQFILLVAAALFILHVEGHKDYIVRVEFMWIHVAVARAVTKLIEVLFSKRADKDC